MTVRQPLWQDPSTSGAPMRQMSTGAGDSIPPGLTTASATRAALNTLAANSQLVVPQLYLITDESRLAVATATNAYQDFVKTNERAIGFGYGGAIPASLVIPLGPVPAALSLTAAGSGMSLLTAPAAALSATIKNGAGTQVGTAAWAVGSRTPTITLTWPYAKGEQGSLNFPSTADTAAAGLGGYLGNG